MSKAPNSFLSFTKLIVDDVDKMTAFYCDVYGLELKQRVQAAIGDEAIDETILGAPGADGNSLILMKYVDRAPPTNGEIVLGFRTDDIEALFERIRAAGGGIYIAVMDDEEKPYKAGFATDPEGHLAEILQFR